MKPDPVALELSRLMNTTGARDPIAPLIARVESALWARPDQSQAWNPLALSSLAFETPTDVRSCWIFVLRAGARFGPERHPNSHQRTVALSGDALFEILVDDSWSPWPVGATTHEPGGTSVISIPPLAWHRIGVGAQNFISVSFHTVPAEQLIEETPLGDDLSITTRRLYHA